MTSGIRSRSTTTESDRRTQRGRKRHRAGRTRAISPLVGTVVLLAITLCLVAVIAAGLTTWSLESSSTAAFDLSVDGDAGTIVLEHVAGDAIDVRELSLTIAVDGTELSSQPSVPFVGTNGFYGAPTGPFNGASDPKWQAGERAGLTVASTNSPGLESGDSVTVRLAVDGQLIAELEADAT